MSGKRRGKSAKRARKPRAVAAKTPAKRRFVDDVVRRGEAAEPTADGTLPQHATHVIKRRTPDGGAEIERVRYKAF